VDPTCAILTPKTAEMEEHLLDFLLARAAYDDAMAM